MQCSAHGTVGTAGKSWGGKPAEAREVTTPKPGGARGREQTGRIGRHLRAGCRRHGKAPEPDERVGEPRGQ